MFVAFQFEILFLVGLYGYLPTLACLYIWYHIFICIPMCLFMYPLLSSPYTVIGSSMGAGQSHMYIYICIYNYIIYIYVTLCSPQVDVQWCTSILLLVSRYSADHRGWTTLLSSRTSQDFTVDVSSKPWWTSGYGSPNVGTNWGSPVCCLPCDPTRSSHPTRPHLLN